MNHALCGGLAPGDRVRVRQVSTGWLTGNSTDASGYGLWILRKAKDGEYAAISRTPCNQSYCWPVEAIPVEAPPGPASDNCARAVTNELVAVLHWIGSTHPADLKLQVFTPAALLFTRIKEYLLSMAPGEQLAAARILSRDACPGVRAFGIAGLLQASDPEGVIRFAANWPRIEDAPDSLNAEKALQKYANFRDVAGMRALGRLASQRSTSPDFDQSVSYVLRNAHTRAALPGLAAFLESQSPIARSFAVTGMCLFTRNAAPIDPALSDYASARGTQSRMSAPFQTAGTERYCRMEDAPLNPEALTPYIEFWKNWWRVNKSRIER